MTLLEDVLKKEYTCHCQMVRNELLLITNDVTKILEKLYIIIFKLYILNTIKLIILLYNSL